MLTDLIELPGGAFRMGSTSFYPDEAPVHTATVGAFAVERHPVTNAQFAEFVADTAYVTFAERPPDPRDYPGADPELLVPSSAVFTPPAHRVDLTDAYQWWSTVGGACWRYPHGPGSGLHDLGDHPAVHIAAED